MAGEFNVEVANNQVNPSCKKDTIMELIKGLIDEAYKNRDELRAWLGRPDKGGPQPQCEKTPINDDGRLGEMQNALRTLRAINREYFDMVVWMTHQISNWK